MPQYDGHTSAATTRALAKKRRIWNPLGKQHTIDHRDCPACQSVNERIMCMDAAMPTMRFSLASERWIEWRRPYVKQRTVETYQTYFAAINRFFGGLPLNEITPGHLREYQRMRSVNADRLWIRVAGPSAVNHELNALSQVLEYAGLWQRLKPYYNPLPLPRWRPPRVMTPEEEERLFMVAASHPEFELAYLVASLTNNTSASGVELRCLQIKHVNVLSTPAEIVIPSDRVKNEFRGRRIPLNETAAKQASRCLARAAKLGAVDKEHYLFPFRVNRNTFDPNRPASRSWLRKQFVKMREAADLPWLRPHDLRHQAVTRMLETGAPEKTVMSITGHISQAMLDHYSHIRMDAKMSVVKAVEPRSFQVAPTRRYA